MTRSAAAWAWAAFAAATLTAVYVAAYGDLVGRFFSFDDFAVLAATDQIQVRGPGDLLRFFEPWPTFAQYRPLTTLGYFWVNRAIFGLDPRPWMVVQLAFHVLNALLVYAIAARLLGSRPAGLATALAYASAPGHAAAVRWFAYFTITGTVFAYFFGLWAWLRLGERWRAPVVLAVFVAGLLCSEHAVSFPAAVTAVAVVGQRRRDWRRLAREVAPLWLVGTAYFAAKLLYVYVLLPRRAPGVAAYLHSAYALSFDPMTALHTLGRFVEATVAALWTPGRSPAWHRAAGGLTLALTAVATGCATLLPTRRRWLDHMACGLALFCIGLAPVLFLPTHVALAYVGIAALGAGLAMVALLCALPRGDVVALGLATVLVAVHLGISAPAFRTSHDFRVIETSGEYAVRWLKALRDATGPDTREVVVPSGELTGRLFGRAHRQFLCATYDVRLVPSTRGVEAGPGRVVVHGMGPAVRDGWQSVVRDCPR